jgi:REP element-mobilizing transposase RayT
MPNHIHGIIILRGAASSAPTLGRIVRAFKSVSAVGANRIMSRSERPFWQRNYYEHIIRDEDELNIIRQYIRDNPLEWEQDPDNPAKR